jgi:hypothetical protein
VTVKTLLHTHKAVLHYLAITRKNEKSLYTYNIALQKVDDAASSALEFIAGKDGVGGLNGGINGAKETLPPAERAPRRCGHSGELRALT